MFCKINKKSLWLQIGRFAIRRFVGTSMSSTSLKNELIETFLNLEKLDVNLFRSHHLLPGVPTSSVVYGGQVIGQSLIAATETVPNDVQPHSLHCYFIRTGNIHKPILYYVDLLRDGRSFYTRSVKAVQDGLTIFSCMVSFQKGEPDSIAHEDTMPNVVAPEDLKNADQLLNEMLQTPGLSEEQRTRIKQRLDGTNTFEIKPTDPEAFLRIKPLSAPDAHVFVWVKAKGSIGDDPRLHQCVAAYISDFSMVSAALIRHVADGFRVGMAFSLDHTMWFHKPHSFAIDEWMLYETWSPKAGILPMICQYKTREK